MKKLIIFVFLCIFCIFLTGCARETIDDSKLNIVTSFYPMYIATANIVDGADNVELKNLTASTTGCLHDYQITTSDMIKLSHADILVINGDGMENFIEKAISSYPKLCIIDASEGLKEKHELLFDYDDEHENIDERLGANEHEHDHDHENNSHYWVSITLYIEQIENIKEKLVEFDPENAEVYEKNAKEYIGKLEKLKKEMHEAIDKFSNKNVVTFHEAFEFFAEEFDLNVVSVIEREPGTYPSSRDVARIIDLIKEKDVKAIFVEPQYSRSAADTISRETGIGVYTLDPIVTGELRKEAYIDIMERNINSLKEALSAE